MDLCYFADIMKAKGIEIYENFDVIVNDTTLISSTETPSYVSKKIQLVFFIYGAVHSPVKWSL